MKPGDSLHGRTKKPGDRQSPADSSNDWMRTGGHGIRKIGLTKARKCTQERLL